MIYKIVPTPVWTSALKDERFAGVAIDLSDGFIHFSTAEQAQETIDKHFAGQTDLVIVAVDPVRLGDALRWEPSRGGALFPHLYATLATSDVAWVRPLRLDESGRADFVASLP